MSRSLTSKLGRVVSEEAPTEPLIRSTPNSRATFQYKLKINDQIMPIDGLMQIFAAPDSLDMLSLRSPVARLSRHRRHASAVINPGTAKTEVSSATSAVPLRSGWPSTNTATLRDAHTAASPEIEASLAL